MFNSRGLSVSGGNIIAAVVVRTGRCVNSDLGILKNHLGVFVNDLGDLIKDLGVLLNNLGGNFNFIYQKGKYENIQKICDK